MGNAAALVCAVNQIAGFVITIAAVDGIGGAEAAFILCIWNGGLYGGNLFL